MQDAEVPGGAIKEIQLTASGKATIRSAEGDAIRIDPYLEGCVYEFSKLSGTFKTPEVATITGEARGKLSKAYTTAKGCEKKLNTEFTLYVEAGGELLTSWSRTGVTRRIHAPSGAEDCTAVATRSCCPPKAQRSPP